MIAVPAHPHQTVSRSQATQPQHRDTAPHPDHPHPTVSRSQAPRAQHRDTVGGMS